MKYFEEVTRQISKTIPPIASGVHYMDVTLTCGHVIIVEREMVAKIGDQFVVCHLCTPRPVKDQSC